MVIFCKNLFFPFYKTYSDTKSKDVHVEVSAVGIHFLFMGVSKVTGSNARATEPAGSPPSLLLRDLVSWCTAALAIP